MNEEENEEEETSVKGHSYIQSLDIRLQDLVLGGLRLESLHKQIDPESDALLWLSYFS
jgi:hypothetical protein